MEARGHIHTDFGHIVILGLGIAVFFHVLRGLGGFMASKGMTGPAKVVSGLATFN